MAGARQLLKRSLFEVNQLKFVNQTRQGFFLLAVLSCAGSLYASSEALNQAVAQQLANAPAEALGFSSEEVDFSTEDGEMYEVYHENGLQALWVTKKGPNKHAKALYAAIERAGEEGLDPEDYHLSSLQQYWNSKGTDDLASLDLLVTLALVAWVNDGSEGRVHPRESDPELFASAGDRRLSAVKIVQTYAGSKDPQAFLAGIHPRHRHYQGLKSALEYYRGLADSGGWVIIPGEGPVLHPGDQDARIPMIRQRLAVTGQWGGPEMDSDLFDEDLEAAVKEFQLMHGLAPDGVVGANTVSEMNVTVEQRIRQIEMNMERWRWMSHDLEDPYVLVDIAGFDLQTFKDDEPVLEMRVIVGKNHHETPIFSDHIQYIEFNPFWNLTPSIARHETVPKARKDPNYLASKHIRVFDGWGHDAKELDPTKINWNRVSNPGKYKFRQDPGPWNALGTMKFIFPNTYNVYLHDTPNHDLFSRTNREFSHGCIRLSEPEALAEWVLSLNDPEWDKTHIDGVLESEQRTVKNLDDRMAVHLTYETAWIDSDARLRFAQDIYGRDARLEEVLYVD